MYVWLNIESSCDHHESYVNDLVVSNIAEFNLTCHGNHACRDWTADNNYLILDNIRRMHIECAAAGSTSGRSHFLFAHSYLMI